MLQALELLRRSRAVSAEDEVKLLAAYDQGTPQSRNELLGLVENLQHARYGAVAVRLRPEGGTFDQEIRRGTRAALEEGKRFVDEYRAELKAEGRAAVEEGEVLVRRYKTELQQFLDENQPTVEAVERVSHDLADAGRQLAGAVKYAGREFADELVKQGKRALSGIDTEAYEVALLEGSARVVDRTGKGLRASLALLGVFFLLVGALLGASLYPPLRTAALIATGSVAGLLGLFLIWWGWRISRGLRAGARELQRLAAMREEDRHEYFRTRLAAEAEPRPRATADAVTDSSRAPTGEKPTSTEPG